MSPGASNPSRILWGSFLATQVAYVVLGWSGLAPRIGVTSDSPLSKLPILFAGLAIVLAVAAHVMFQKTRAAAPGPIVAWALDEAIALLGLVLCLFGFPPATWLPFSGIGFALTVLHAPRAE